MENEKEINLKQIFKILLAYKISIISSFTLFSIVSIIFTLTLYNEYRAGTSLVPNNIIKSSGQNITSSLGGLASFAGLGSGSSASNEVIIAKEIMQSQEFISNFVRKNDLLIHIMATKGWDFKNNRLSCMIKEGIIDPSKVTRVALQNAVSVASILITTNNAIVESRNEGIVLFC